MKVDPFNLKRFLEAQEGIYPTVLAELQAGRKRTHWMWFIFPQAIGLGHSVLSQHYAIHSRAEANAYLSHPVLGERLQACTQAVLALENTAVSAIFGHPDDLKFHASMTLFTRVEPGDTVFQQALDAYFGGQNHAGTTRILTTWHE
ncbi:MAG: DUF1810 domain-containing protein [Anaerolineae bacterium]|jgi:uncharacterized protein (DUF1810 family)|nr:DUF1810 domain-containing protein [Anaerolineae bacterium]